MNLSHDTRLLIQEWSHETSYTVQHGAHTCAISTDQGILQGSKGSPPLWSVFICDVLADLAKMTGWAWMLSALTVYADDIHCGQLLYDVSDLTQFMENVGHLLYLLQTAGLSLSPSKSAAILQLRGKTATQTMNLMTVENANGRFLRFATSHMPVFLIALQTSATYLGVTMSYGNFACLTLTQRYALWRSTVVAVMFYGIISTDISTAGITKLNSALMKQIRQLTGNYAHITGDTHTSLLQQLGCASPVAMLQQAVRRMHCTVANRPAQVQHSDILHTLHWARLDTLSLRLDSFQVDANAQAVTLSDSMWHCSICNTSFTNSTGLNTHMKRVHHHDTRGARRMYIATDAVDGLPQCKHCGKWLASWKNFEEHIGTHKDLPEDIPDDPLHWMKDWVQKPMGRTVLELMQNNDWDSIGMEQETCTWLGDHCLLCGTFSGGSIHKMNSHLRSQHQSLIEGVFDRANKNLLARLGKPPYMRKLCSKHVSTGHICPVGVQLTSLTMHLCPRPNTQTGTVVREYNVARDSSEGQPTCAHCGMQCASLATLRTHIQFCTRFDATRSHEASPLKPGFSLAVQLGSLAEYLALADTRAEFKLFLYSNACGRHLFAPHHVVFDMLQLICFQLVWLQTEHSTLWSKRFYVYLYKYIPRGYRS